MDQPVGRRYDRQVRFGRILGLFLVAAGFATIGFAWNGTARLVFVDAQFPYLVSGGVTGLGLIVLGVGLMLMSQVRAERIKLGDQLEQVGTTLSKATAAGGQGGSAANGQVVAGRSTFHRPDCRLVKGKTDLEYVTVEVAKSSGLSACRVCSPEGEARRSRKGAAARK